LKIAVHTSLWICENPSFRKRVLADPDFYKKSVYSIVQVANTEEEDWFAQVLVLFRARHRNWCLVQCSRMTPTDAELVEDETRLRRLVLVRHFQVRSRVLNLA